MLKVQGIYLNSLVILDLFYYLLQMLKDYIINSSHFLQSQVMEVEEVQFYVVELCVGGALVKHVATRWISEIDSMRSVLNNRIVLEIIIREQKL